MIEAPPILPAQRGTCCERGGHRRRGRRSHGTDQPAPGHTKHRPPPAAATPATPPAPWPRSDALRHDQNGHPTTMPGPWGDGWVMADIPDDPDAYAASLSNGSARAPLEGFREAAIRRTGRGLKRCDEAVPIQIPAAPGAMAAAVARASAMPPAATTGTGPTISTTAETKAIVDTCPHTCPPASMP